MKKTTMASAEVLQLPIRRRRRARHPVLGVADGRDATLDLDRLMHSRLLITAASGGGKSFALRRLLEQTEHLVQQLVIDPEGELVTLAERFPYLVLSADSEDTPLRVETADQLARSLWRSGHSAVLSLDAMEVEDMQAFIANFLRGLMATPRCDWSPLLMAVDEAQIIAPQSDRSEAKRPLIDVAARGRKRGICPVVATQRVSMVSKSVVAQLQNQLVGLTTLDNDVERAAELLGLKQAKAADTLRNLDTGEFLMYGPALGYDVRTVKIGPVQTQHGALGRLGSRRRRPSSKNRILARIRELGTPPPLEDVVSSTPASVRECALTQLARFRHWVIAPLLAEDAVHGAVAARCRDLELTHAEVSQWMRDFRALPELRALQPKRLRQSMVRDMERLQARMQQPTASTGVSVSSTPVRRVA